LDEKVSKDHENKEQQLDTEYKAAIEEITKTQEEQKKNFTSTTRISFNRITKITQ